MEGYSVTEAASVLGVPTERVWELLARGVLSGAPDGETGMRVYLQPRPAPPPSPIDEFVRPSNGDARSEPDREMSPFRELLTEFRNLTERYGQALLALGESRGEVASLRSRVDLLEARMDLRLPPAAAPAAPAPRSVADWTTGREVPTPAPGEDEPEDDADRRARRRRSSQRRATEAFAEAMGRAFDPTAAELPPAEQTAAALAALREERQASPVPVDRQPSVESIEPTAPVEPAEDATLPRELPAADAMPLPEEDVEPPTDGVAAPVDEDLAAVSPAVPVDVSEETAVVDAAPPAGEDATQVVEEAEAGATAAPEIQSGQAHESAAEREPDMAAEETLEPAGAVDPEPEPAGEPEAEPEPPALAVEPEPEAEPEPPALAVEPEPEAEPEPPAPAEETAPAWEASHPELVIEPDTEPRPGAEPGAESPADQQAAVAAEPLESDAIAQREPIEWDPARYTVEIAEPDWFAGEEPMAASEPPAAAAEESPGTVEASDGHAEPVEAPRTDDAGTPADEEVAPAAAGDDQPRGVESAPPSSSPPPVAAPPAPPSPSVASAPAPSGSRAGFEQEEEMLWFGRRPSAPPPAAETGADEMEIAGRGRHVDAMPGGAELDDALAALDALARSAETPPEPPRTIGWSTDAPAPVAPAASPGSTTTPAGRAYRRLRRIFPG